MRDTIVRLLQSSMLIFSVNFFVGMARQYLKLPHPAYATIVAKSTFTLAVLCLLALIWVR